MHVSLLGNVNVFELNVSCKIITHKKIIQVFTIKLTKIYLKGVMAMDDIKNPGCLTLGVVGKTW